ncbi:MAG TPA: CDP-alcohol phosphatidyltransferase family protein [Dongiaceae bacterium]
MTGRQRLERALGRAGIGLVRESEATAGGLVLMRDDFIYDEILISALARRPGAALVESAPLESGPVESGPGKAVVAVHLPAGWAQTQAASVDAALASGSPVGAEFQAVDAAGLASTYNQGLRKRAAPYLIRLGSMPEIEIERRMFNGAYKGVTDFVTKRIWPLPAFHVTRVCAAYGISPNLVTLVSLVMVLLAMWMFWIGDFGFGLVAAWSMCFLDTVDGKLARVTLNSSKFGNAFDHGIDLVHPPFWYYAWYHGLQSLPEGSDTAVYLALILVIACYLGGRLQEGIFIWLYHIEIHTWRPVDSWFREITARRNPNLFILSVAVAFGGPAEGFLVVALWSSLSFLFHTVRILQAAFATATGRAPVSWLSEPISTMPIADAP